ARGEAQFPGFELHLRERRVHLLARRRDQEHVVAAAVRLEIVSRDERDGVGDLVLAEDVYALVLVPPDLAVVDRDDLRSRHASDERRPQIEISRIPIVPVTLDVNVEVLGGRPVYLERRDLLVALV